MNLRLLTSVVLVAYIVLAGFGLYVPIMNMGHDGHEMGCPFAPGNMAICAAPLAHIEHWQSAFITILAEILILAAVLIFLGSPLPIHKVDPKYERYRLYACMPGRPSLFQELFSNGILNPKVF